MFALLGIAATLNRTAIFDSNDSHLQSRLGFLREKLPAVAEQVISVPVRVGVRAEPYFQVLADIRNDRIRFPRCLLLLSDSSTDAL